MTVPAFLSISGSPITSSGTFVVGLSGTALPVTSGGTGDTTLTAHAVLIGNGTSGITFVAPATSGNLLTSNGTDWVSSAPATSGTVTSVAMSVPAFLSVAGSPVTSSGTLAVSYSGTALPVANGGTGVTSLGTLSDAGTDGITVTGGTGALITSASLSQHVSDSTHNGYLSSTDWVTFNAKIDGPGTVVSGNVASFSGTTGKSVADSGIRIAQASSGGFTNRTLCLGPLTGAVTSGIGNTLIGYGAGQSVTTASQSTMVGEFAGGAANASDCTFVGTQCVGNSATPGNKNTAFGSQCFLNLTTGTENVGIGYNAAPSASFTGSHNIIIGSQSAAALTTGTYNICIGDGSGGVVTTGSNNIWLGRNATGLTVGESNTMVIGSAQGNINDVYLGRGEGLASGFGSVTIHGTDGQGANVSATSSDVIFMPGRGTGTGSGGLLKWQYAVPGSTGSTLNSTADAMVMDKDSGMVAFPVGLKTNTAGAQPTCTAAIRGAQWVIQGASGVADVCQVCIKDASDSYAWATAVTDNLGETITGTGGATATNIATYTTIATATLTPGTWLVSGSIQSDNSGTQTGMDAALFVKGATGGVTGNDYLYFRLAVTQACAATFTPRVVTIVSGDADKTIAVKSRSTTAAGSCFGYVVGVRIA